MANTINIPRPQLILMAVCLPLAVLVGFLLADPRSSSLGVVALIFGVLLTPLLMKWYHPLLIFSCNAAFEFTFLPGSPPLWLLVAFAGLFFTIMNRCVDPYRRLMIGGQIAWALLGLGMVVFVTAFLRGGAGVAALGSASYGGRRYIYIAGAIAAYFTLASQRVPQGRAMLYAGIFFLAGATTFLSLLAYFAGNKLSFLSGIMSQDTAAHTAFEHLGGDLPIVRYSGLGGICTAGILFLLARYGVKGIFERLWRLVLTGFFLTATLWTGYRSAFGFVALIFTICFFAEGLHRTRYLFLTTVMALVCSVFLFAFSKDLPLQVQRSLSFLPVKISPLAKQDAQSSLNWRMEMWKIVVADIPQYLFKGKGYALDPGDMYMSQVNSHLGRGFDSDWAIFAGDYHNGPLSVLIPFGIWGAAALVWFFMVTVRMLYQNYTQGDPSLKTINRVLLAVFTGKMIFFVFLVGGFYSDLVGFTALAGLAMSLNGDKRRTKPEEWMAIPEMTAHKIGGSL